MKSHYIESPHADKIREGTIACVEALFSATSLVVVKRAFFDTACWLVSERNGKFNTRYRSQSSLNANNAILRHEHVIPRSSLWFVARRSLSPRDALLMCEGCIVTEDEHRKLHAAEDTYSWDRYAKAGVTVIDMTTGVPLEPEHLLRMGEPFLKAYRESRLIGDGEAELEIETGAWPHD